MRLFTIALLTLSIASLSLTGCAKPADETSATTASATMASAAWTIPTTTVSPTTPAPSVTTVIEQIGTASPVTPADESFVLSLEGYGNAGALADPQLSILDMLTYAIQDEYTAHGEYRAIQDEFGVRSPYDNIMKSEEKHIASLAALYGSYGLAVPTDDSADHVVVPVSLLEAARTGVQAEIYNIMMYERFLEETLPADIQSVFESLMTASESHLSAFERQVDRLS